MDDPLPQPREEQRVLERARAVGAEVGGSVVQEHEIEIRAMTELDATQLAVGHDHEIRIAGLALAFLRCAVFGKQILPAETQHVPEDRLGEEAQVVAHLHQRERARHLRGRAAQPVGELEIPQRFHLCFEVVLRHAQHVLAQFGRQAFALGQHLQAARVDQLIEQHRVVGKFLRDPRACRAERHHLRERGGVLGEQHQIGAAAQHGLDQRHGAQQQQRGLLAACSCSQKERHETIEPLAPRCLQRAHTVAVVELGQTPARTRRVFESRCCQRFLQIF